MENISSYSDLQDAILLLELEQADKLKLMKEQFHMAYENLKPAKLIENTLKDIIASPHLVDNIVVTFIGLVTGYLSQKAITHQSNSKFRKLLGYVLQLGITNLVAQNAKTIKLLGQFMFHNTFRKGK